MTLFDSQSPLRRLPTNLNARQRLFLDGIRYSIEGVGMAYYRLQENLLRLSTSPPDDRPHSEFPETVMLSWAIVDNVNRLRVLVEHMPKTKRTPVLRVFLSKLEPFEDLRNPIQHLNQQLRDVKDDDDAGRMPLWGSLSWCYVPSGTSIKAFALVAGSLARYEGLPVFNPADKEFRSNIDHIELAAFGHQVSLSRTAYAIVDYAERLETNLRPQFEGHPVAGADILIALNLEFPGEAT